MNQQDDKNQEFKALISSIPKEQGWIVSHYVYQYQGYWYTLRQLQGVLQFQNHFQAQPTDLFLITSPKSGTTWLKAIIYSIANRAKWDPQDLDHPILKANPHHLIPFIEHMGPQLDDHLTKLSPPRVLATHTSFESLPKSVIKTGCKIVFLCRNPKDVCISSWHFVNKMRPKGKEELTLEQAVDKFCKGVSDNGPFWEHVLGYWKSSLDNPNKVFFLKYEDMKQQPELYLKKMAEFCGCPFSEQEENQGSIKDILKLCSFDSLSNLEVNKSGKMAPEVENNIFFRKGEVGDWVNYFTPEMTQRFDKICQEKFLPWGLRF